MNRQSGVALITAMIVVALATVIAATLLFDSAMTARRSAGSFSMEQAIELSKGGEALAAYALLQDKNQQDSSLDPWAQYVPPVEVAPEISIEAQVTDEQGKFNVNTPAQQGRHSPMPMQAQCSTGCWNCWRSTPVSRHC